MVLFSGRTKKAITASVYFLFYLMEALGFSIKTGRRRNGDGSDELVPILCFAQSGGGGG